MSVPHWTYGSEGRSTPEDSVASSKRAPSTLRYRVFGSPAKFVTKTSGRPSPSRSPIATPIPARASFWSLRPAPVSTVTSSKVPSPLVAVEDVRRPVVRDVEVRPAVSVVVEEDGRKAAPPRVEDARLLRALDEPPVLSLHVQLRLLPRVVLRDANLELPERALLRIVRVEIADDVEVHASVPVHVPGGEPDGVSGRGEAALLRLLAERAVAEVLPDLGPADAGHDEVEPPLAIEVHPRRAHPPAAGADPRAKRHVLERAVAAVPVEHAAGAGLRLPAAGRGPREEEVREGVAVEVPHGDARAHRGEVPPAAQVRLELEADPRALRHVGEADGWRPKSTRRIFCE